MGVGGGCYEEKSNGGTFSSSSSERTATNRHTATASTTDGHMKRQGRPVVQQNDVVCTRTFVVGRGVPIMCQVYTTYYVRQAYYLRQETTENKGKSRLNKLTDPNKLTTTKSTPSTTYQDQSPFTAAAVIFALVSCLASSFVLCKDFCMFTTKHLSSNRIRLFGLFVYYFPKKSIATTRNCRLFGPWAVRAVVHGDV